MSTQIKRSNLVFYYLPLATLVIMLQIQYSLVVQNAGQPPIIMVQWQQTLDSRITSSQDSVRVERKAEENQEFSPNCSWPKLGLLDPPGPVTALVSRPGSGNTWVRHLLQLATGIQTGSVFNERKLKLGGFPGEGISDGRAVAIKAHNLKRTYDRYIAIVRHPLHAGLAEFNRVETRKVDKERSHTGHANMTLFSTSKWHDFMQKIYIRGYTEFMGGLFSLDQEKLCVIEYENLVKDVIQELKPCVEFVGFHIDEDLAHCIRKDYEGSYHRKPLSKEELHQIFTNSFTNEELKHYDSMYEKFLYKLGKTPLF